MDGQVTPEYRQEEASPRSSVKVTRNAKGEAQWEVKVLAGDSEEELEEARKIAVSQFRALAAELS